jgi:photosynthetic reaction center H subunit
MHNLVFAGNFDLTSLVFGSFVLFFIGLVIYLRREDRREGYPLENDVTGQLEPGAGFLFAATPKTFLLPHGEGTLTKPNGARDTHELKARRTGRAPGTPIEPAGDPMLAGVGPGAYAHRAKVPDLTNHGLPKVVPLRVATAYSLDPKDPDPRGMKVVGADGVSPGVVSDAWIDRGEYMIRYLEIALETGRRVLLPMPMAVVNKWSRTVKVEAILGSQFAAVPTLSNPDQITFDEEERVAAYYGGGLLYATSQRGEPLL